MELSICPSTASTPSTFFVEEVVDRLQKVIAEQLSKQLQVVSANVTGRLETLFEEFLSQQDVVFEKLAEVVQGQKQKHAETSQSEEVVRSISSPDGMFCNKTESETSRYAKLLRDASCSSRQATVTRLQLLHRGQLLRKPGRSHSELTFSSCPGDLQSRSSLDSIDPSKENPRLQESKKKYEKTVGLDTGLTGKIDHEGMSTDTQNGGIAGATRVTKHALPGAIQDDVNFVSVVSSSSPVDNVHEALADTDASPVASDPKEVVYSYDENPGNSIVQTDSKRTTEFLRLGWASCGIVHWSSHMGSRWYRRLIIFVTGCSVLHSMYELVLGPGGIFEKIVHLSLYSCAFFNLIFLRDMGSMVGPLEDQFTEYARDHTFLDEWASGGVLRLLFTAIIWATTTSLMCVPLFMKATNYYTIILRACRDGLLLAILHCLWHVLAFLDLMIDSYCFEIFEHLNCQIAVASWNRLQALLHHVAESVENCFLVVQSTMMVTLLCCTAQVVIMSTRSSMESIIEDDLITVIPPLFLLGLIAAVLFAKAASVTEKCLKAVPLVNSVTMDDDQLSHERQYLVAYIVQSNAGFYIKGSRFTKAMLVKSCYFIGTIICGLGTTILTIRQKS